jgi:hypothetical protein
MGGCESEFGLAGDPRWGRMVDHSIEDRMGLVTALTHALEMSGCVAVAMVANCSLGRQCLTLGFIEETFGTLQIGHAGSLRDVFWAQNHTSETHNVQVKLDKEEAKCRSPGQCQGR